MASGQPKQYYSVLGLSKKTPQHVQFAVPTRNLPWHPDKCSVRDRAEAKVKFQEIQEAYAEKMPAVVLSDERKKLLYDSGLYNPEDDDDDQEGLSNFISEMSGMMTDMQASEVEMVEGFMQLAPSLLYSARIAN